MTRFRTVVLGAIGGGCLLLFAGCGALMGAVSDAEPGVTVTATTTATPSPAVTRTASGAPVVVTAPAETSTAQAPPPVTAPAPTVFVDAPAPAANVAAATDEDYGTCKAAIAAGVGPYTRGIDPEYAWYKDADGDGVVCER